METANTNTTASGTMTGTTANFNQWSNASFIRSQIVGESVDCGTPISFSITLSDRYRLFLVSQANVLFMVLFD